MIVAIIQIQIGVISTYIQYFTCQHQETPESGPLVRAYHNSPNSRIKFARQRILQHHIFAITVHHSCHHATENVAPTSPHNRKLRPLRAS